MRGSQQTVLQKQQIVLSLTPTIETEESTWKSTHGFRVDNKVHNWTPPLLRRYVHISPQSFMMLQLLLNSSHVNKTFTYLTCFSWKWWVYMMKQWLNEFCSYVACFAVLLKTWKTCLLVLNLESWCFLPKYVEWNFLQGFFAEVRSQQNSLCYI